MRITLKKITLAFLCFISWTTFAQIEGDDLFGVDQVVRIDLTFHQTDYWDSLTTNYTTSDYMKADLVITEANGTVSNFTDVGVRLKGNSTYNHPNNKKPFKIDFNKYVVGQDYDGLKKLNFNNNFKDPSMMREKVFFDLCREAEIPAPRTNFANVYMNGSLTGFYTVVEQIDDQFLDWNILDDDGNLFKAGDNFGGGPGGAGQAADLIHYGTTAVDYGERYELKTNEDIADWSDLVSLLDFINNSSDTDFENNFGTHFNTNEFARSVAIDNLFANLDSYTGSARNYYLYHNMTTNKWEWVKWDANEAFGSYASNAGGNITSLAINYYEADRPLLERLFASNYLYSVYQVEMCNLLENHFSNAILDPKIDALKTLIQADVYADNNKMYTDANFNTNIESNITSGGGPGGGTVYGLKSFIQARVDYITGVLDCTTLNTTELLKDNEVTIFPNPSETSSTVFWGGTSIETLELININGQTVINESVKGLNKKTLEIGHLPKGVYSVLLKSSTSIKQLKLVKSN